MARKIKLTPYELSLMDYLACQSDTAQGEQRYKANTPNARIYRAIQHDRWDKRYGFGWEWKFNHPDRVEGKKTPTLMSVARKLEKKGMLTLKITGKRKGYERSSKGYKEAKLTLKGWLAYAQARNLPIHHCDDISFDMGVVNVKTFRKSLITKVIGDDSCYEGLVDYRTPEQLNEHRWWGEYVDSAGDHW